MICKWCGKGFKPKTRRDKYCCVECSKEARKEQSRENANRYYQKHKTISYTTCVICGKKFEAKQGGAITCGWECRQKYHQIKLHENYERKKTDSIQVCTICGKEFESKSGWKVCGEECRIIRNRIKQREFYEKYKPIALKRAKEKRERLKEEECVVEVERRPLDGKVLHRAEMTVDEYNRTHGTNYSYGQYVFYVESKGV